MGIFGKSKDQDSPPTNNGNSVISTYVTVPTYEGSPTVKIVKMVTIGSQAGDLIIQDDSISAKHCTITLSNGVLSVIDHNSETGTYIGKKQIKANRTFIFNPNDKIKVGRHFLEFIEKEETVSFTASDIDANIAKTEVLSGTEINRLNETIEHELEKNATTGGLTEADLYDEVDNESDISDDTNLALNKQVKNQGTLTGLSVEEILKQEKDDPEEAKGKTATFDPLTEVKELSRKEKKALEKERKKREKEEKKKKKQEAKKRASVEGEVPAIRVGPILRLASFGIDFLISLSCINIFNGIFGVAELLKALREAFAIPPIFLYNEYVKEYAISILGEKNEVEILNVITTFAQDQEYFFEGLYLMFLIRAASSLLLGNTLGQILVFLHNSKKSMISGRILASLREILGQLFFPLFIISEFPGLLGKRTLKEVLTTQSLYSRSKLKSSLLMPFTLLFSFAIFSLSPLFADLKLQPTLDVFYFPKNAKNKKKLSNVDYFKYFKFSVQKDLTDFELIPTFVINKVKEKEMIHPVLNLHHKKSKKLIQLKLIKNFNIRDLVNIGTAPNPFAPYLYPSLIGLVNDAGMTHKNLKGRKTGDYWENIQKELHKLFLVSFHHPIEKVHESMMINGPIFTGTVNFRSAFEKIIGKDIESITLDYIGETPVIRLATDNKIKYEELIISIQDTSYLYALKSENPTVTYKDIKPFFDQLGFVQPKSYKKLMKGEEENSFGPAQIIDFFADANLEGWQRSLLNKFLVDYYKERIIYHLANENLDTLNLYKESLKNIINKVNILSNTFVVSEINPVNPYNQLILGLNELLRALEEDDRKYFNLGLRTPLTNDKVPDMNKK